MIDGTKKLHIVMVDDEPVNLELAENALKNTYKLTKLISGAQLLTFLTRVQPNMILLDIQMPEMTGYEVIERIMDNPKTRDIPVIFLTGQEGSESEKRGFMLGAKDFIRKPFDNDIMLARINSQMELYLYRTYLEEIITQKTQEISELHQLLTRSCAEMVESRDGTTGYHVRNTTTYFELLVKAMIKHPLFGLEEGMLEELLQASYLHDIGKIGISDAILKKNGPLNSEEFGNIMRHSQIGGDMLAKILTQTNSHYNGFLEYARAMALYHHERWDGTGYPYGLKGEEIPVYVRALSVTDVYDALTSVRPYKRAFTHDESLEIMRQDIGRFYDPDIFKVFLEIEDEIKSVVKQGV